MRYTAKITRKCFKVILEFHIYSGQITENAQESSKNAGQFPIKGVYR